jgi:hypothetical protein
MKTAGVLRSVKLEDQASPRSAQYVIYLKKLYEGYVVETVWGGALDRKQSESYFRPSLATAQEKFEKILAAKTGNRCSRQRRYRLAGETEYVTLAGIAA